MERFVPVKVTDRKWAEKLVKGEVFMRALNEFGSWTKTADDKTLGNNYRGDIYTGATKVFRDPKDYDFMKGFPEDFVNAVSEITLIDQSDVRFFKVFSLYRYEYDAQQDCLIKPDPRMAQFGDTAVVITDFCEFLTRFVKAADKAYKECSILADEVQFFDFSTTRELNPLFSKNVSQAYQKEFRLAICELEKDEFAMGPGAENAMRIIQDLEPVKIQIGDIRDITEVLTIDQFINGWLPPWFICRWPMNDFPKAPSIFENMVADTRRQVKEYHSFFVKPLMTIR